MALYPVKTNPPQTRHTQFMHVESEKYRVTVFKVYMSRKCAKF